MTNGPLPPALRLLERVTAAVLVLVLVLLGGMLLAAYWPAAAGLVPLEVQVVVVLTLLAAALGLVSVLALWQTRS